MFIVLAVNLFFFTVNGTKNLRFPDLDTSNRSIFYELFSLNSDAQPSLVGTIDHFPPQKSFHLMVKHIMWHLQIDKDPSIQTENGYFMRSLKRNLLLQHICRLPIPRHICWQIIHAKKRHLTPPNVLRHYNFPLQRL